MSIAESAAGTAEQEGFVRFFAEGWAKGANGGLEHFMGGAHPDVLLVQPLMPTTRGLAHFRAGFERLFAAIPDMRGEVIRWGPTDDGVLIELTLRGTLGGRALEWTVVDRIVLEDGLIRSRHSYFDSLPLLRVMLTRPLASLRLLPVVLRKGNR